ncbi:MAG: hypothetical protein CSA50_06955 [Gammaproteobacteria bacterium]|nr:MAG: hypothetical protein CSA50_06955 [Gammaproteobacteria bacterium]
MSLPLQTKATIARRLTLASYALLILLLVFTTFDGSVPPEASKGIILSIKLLPLLILLPGLIKRRTRSHIWLCFIVLLYFTQASAQFYLTQWATLPMLYSILTATLFICSMLYVNWQNKASATNG